jgi:prepilin-type N-terminal cleavage/methylation domain-containing protein
LWQKSGAGFTLLEVVVVMGIMTMLGGFALIVSLDVYRGYAFRTERDMLIAILHKARSQSMNNICLGVACTDGRPHGVHIATGQYVIFQGASYAARDAAVDEVIPATNATASIVPSSLSEVVFTQLSGTAAPVGTVGLTDSAVHISTITINSEGQITWTN